MVLSHDEFLLGPEKMGHGNGEGVTRDQDPAEKRYQRSLRIIRLDGRRNAS